MFSATARTPAAAKRVNAKPIRAYPCSVSVPYPFYFIRLQEMSQKPRAAGEQAVIHGTIKNGNVEPARKTCSCMCYLGYSYLKSEHPFRRHVLSHYAPLAAFMKNPFNHPI